MPFTGPGIAGIGNPYNRRDFEKFYPRVPGIHYAEFAHHAGRWYREPSTSYAVPGSLGARWLRTARAIAQGLRRRWKSVAIGRPFLNGIPCLHRVFGCEEQPGASVPGSLPKVRDR